MTNEYQRIGWEQSELIYKNPCGYKRNIMEVGVIKQMDNFDISY